ncbi:MAG: integrase [Desulfurococcaceae archaeon]|nr:integrase [Desulfurococcaceae archaeon]
MGGVPSSPRWFERVDVRGLSEDSRRAILERVKEKLGFNKTLEVLGISKGSLHNYLHGVRKIPDNVVYRALQYLEEWEFNSIIGGFDRLRAAGIVRADGTVDYSLVLQAIALATRDEYLKQALLRFTVENFREDLRRMLGLSLAHVVFRWEPGFEEFLRERKKRRKVTDPETIAYYRNLFERYLEGRVLSEELVNYVVSHPNKWLRNVFRHYVQYLYYMRRIPPETYGWLMEVVPSRSYRLDVRSYPIDLNDVVRTLSTLREEHELYYLIYRLMLEGGLRLSHALLVVRGFNPREVVEVGSLGLDTPRLVCFEGGGFCRYYVGVRGTQKPCEWAYLSTTTLELLEEYAGTKVGRRSLERFVSRRSLLPAKYMRKVAWRLMIRVMPREVARFIQSRFGELRVSEARYEDLLSEADTYYPRYLEELSKLVTQGAPAPSTK